MIELQVHLGLHRLQQPVVIVTARGLCKESLFDTTYTYTIGEGK